MKWNERGYEWMKIGSIQGKKYEKNEKVFVEIKKYAWILSGQMKKTSGKNDDEGVFIEL